MGLLSDDRWQVFLDATIGPDEELLPLRRRAEAEQVPIIRRECEFFMNWLFGTLRPERILEIGAAIGYSSLYIWRVACRGNCRITTIEMDEDRADQAEANFREYGASEAITLIRGDATIVLSDLQDEYDLIFLDAAKGQYITMLPDIKRLLKSGGVLLCDNILVANDTLRSRYALERRDRTIHKRMRQFLEEICRDQDMITDILPIGDGISVSTKCGAAASGSQS